MKNLIKTANSSSPPIAEYDRVIYNPITDNVVVMGGAYVDLGLPSGLKWAKCNLGAARETDYGYYFQWGEAEPQDTNIPFNWTTYKHCNGSERTLTKYCTNNYYGTVDNKTTLDTEDDAVSQVMGDGWRMPTQTELQELLNYTDHTWVDNFNSSGVSGYKFTSRTDENKYLFIPAAGYCVNSMVGRIGLYGFMWSSSLNSSRNNSAWYMYFVSGVCTVSYINRSYGGSIRGVHE